VDVSWPYNNEPVAQELEALEIALGSNKKEPEAPHNINVNDDVMRCDLL
jgi:hypothetical protein